MSSEVMGANGYYRSSFGPGNFLFTYLIISSLTGPRYYSTPRSRVGTIRSGRSNYRGSTAYRSQVSRNSSYFSRQKSFHGSRYTNARPKSQPGEIGLSVPKPDEWRLQEQQDRGEKPLGKLSKQRLQGGIPGRRRGPGGHRI